MWYKCATPTEAQIVARAKAKLKKEAHGGIESEHRYLGSQDTFCVGTIKGVGRIYQQTFIETHPRVADVKLYDRKPAISRGRHASTGSGVGNGSGGNDDDECDEQTMENFLCELYNAVSESELDSPDGPDYTSDNNWWFNSANGFDCDDFAQALEGWLETQLLPHHDGAVISTTKIRWVGWGSKQYHLIVKIEHNGVTYYADGQTGFVSDGATTQQEEIDAIEDLLDDGYGGVNPTTNPNGPVILGHYDDASDYYNSHSNEETTRRDEFFESLLEAHPDRSIDDYFPGNN